MADPSVAGPADAAVSDRIVTVPNALSVLRLLGVPVFLWFLLGPHWDWAALGLLMVSGATDWLDGKLARALGQTSRLGTLLDPAADRLYIAATLVAFSVRGIVPLVLTGVLVARDVLMALPLWQLRRHGYGPPPVHYLGKAATFNLLYAFPLLLVGAQGGTVGTAGNVLGWAFTVWGTGLYWFAAALYVVQVRRLTRGDPPSGTGAVPASGSREAWA